jgi:hypothetical protein
VSVAGRVGSHDNKVHAAGIKLSKAADEPTLGEIDGARF